MKKVWEYIKIIILYVLSYLPIISLILITLFSKNTSLDLFTLFIVIFSFCIRDLGVDITSKEAINIILKNIDDIEDFNDLNK